MSIDETAEFLRTVELSSRERQIAERVLKEIQERLRFLLDVGLDYLSRPMLWLQRKGHVAARRVIECQGLGENPKAIGHIL